MIIALKTKQRKIFTEFDKLSKPSVQIVINCFNNREMIVRVLFSVWSAAQRAYISPRKRCDVRTDLCTHFWSLTPEVKGGRSDAEVVSGREGLYSRVTWERGPCSQVAPDKTSTSSRIAPSSHRQWRDGQLTNSPAWRQQRWRHRARWIEEFAENKKRTNMQPTLLNYWSVIFLCFLTYSDLSDCAYSNLRWHQNRFRICPSNLNSSQTHQNTIQVQCKYTCT